MATIVERTEGHYDVQEVEFGRVYRWCPERIVVDCSCGQRLTLTAASTVTCRRCGADHTSCIREEPTAGRLKDETLHPWRYAGDLADDGLPF
jgi:hypothetical protein